jgi:hypothetical protein
MASSRPPPSKSVDLDLAIVSSKHLKNVNWKAGDFKLHVVFWLDPDRRLATKSDDSDNTSPVWNERFILSLFHFLFKTPLSLSRSSIPNILMPPNPSSPPFASPSMT